MSLENTHKPIRIYMGDLILGVRLYNTFLLLQVGKGLIDNTWLR